MSKNAEPAGDEPRVRSLGESIAEAATKHENAKAEQAAAAERHEIERRYRSVNSKLLDISNGLERRLENWLRSGPTDRFLKITLISCYFTGDPFYNRPDWNQRDIEETQGYKTLRNEAQRLGVSAFLTESFYDSWFFNLGVERLQIMIYASDI